MGVVCEETWEGGDGADMPHYGTSAPPVMFFMGFRGPQAHGDKVPTPGTLLPVRRPIERPSRSTNPFLQGLPAADATSLAISRSRLAQEAVSLDRPRIGRDAVTKGAPGTDPPALRSTGTLAWLSEPKTRPCSLWLIQLPGAAWRKAHPPPKGH